MASPETKGTVLVVDDDPSVRRGVTRLLQSSGFAVQTFGSAQEYLTSSITPTPPACLVLDVMLPGLDGLGLQKELESRDDSIPIVFITGHGEISDSVKAMKRGAVDFLPKPFDDEDLLRAVGEALEQDSKRRVACDLAQSIRERVERLTPREYEVLGHVIAGQLNKQIGFALGIAEKTVKVHRGRMMEKMEVASVAELVRLAEKVGIEPAQSSS
jgi:FixJ family two-component response regulator